MHNDEKEPHLDPLKLAVDLTAKMGASIKYSFDVSVDKNTGAIRDVAKRYEKHLDEWPSFTREAYGNLYDADDIEEIPNNEKSEFGTAAMGALELQPHFPELRASSSAHRVVASEMGAKMSALVAKALELDDVDEDSIKSEDPRELENIMETTNQMLDEAGASDEEKEKALDELSAEHASAQTSRAALIKKLASPQAQALIGMGVRKLAQEAKQGAEAIGMLRSFGLDPATDDGDAGIDEELIKMLKENKMLLDVLKECGRIKDAAAATGEAHVTTGRCDVVGVEVGDDVTRLLNEELALLDDEDLGDHTLARLLSSEALCWEMAGAEYREKGDVVLLVDRSGSMHGAPMVYARALAAASMIQAVKQGRRVVLCMFSGGAPTIATVSRNGGMKKAIKALGLEASGGTDVEQAFAGVHNHGFSELRDPDVLLVTDGYFDGESSLLKKQLDRFPKGTRFNGLYINTSAQRYSWMTNMWEANGNLQASGDTTALEIFKTIGSKSTTEKKK
jgi:uncharacterized protein with von Willebrand factor type A (vWA) domain